MCRVSLEARDSFRAWFVPMVTGTAERNQVRRFVGRLHAPRNDVMHVHQFPSARKIRGQLPAVFAGLLVAVPHGRRNPLPVLTAPVVTGRSTLPSRAIRSRLCPGARRGIARMAAVGARIALGKREARSAVGADRVLRSNPAPPVPVVARHIAEPPGSGVVGERFKSNAATLADLLNAGARFPLGAAHPAVPCRASIRSGAVSRAVFSPRPSGERHAAFGAGVMGCFHALNIAGTGMGINDFDIACRRVDEATRQPDLFVEMPKPAKPQSLFDGAAE